jgi:SpoVK/Ycf46/Vps4 family AAA+-type ATPase
MLPAVFLRLVEYYEGIMLLTTNRISTIDPAFESRVDVAIAYDDLTAPLRQQIWENFLFKLHGDGAEVDADSLTDAALRGLAEHELNGRQIKSVIKTAQLLARSKEQALGMGHLNAVLALNQGRGKVA